jgi:hypothetical protein
MPAALKTYYAAYTKLGYFVELHRGGYAGDGEYRIEELSRDDFDGWYPDRNGEVLGWEYWQSCDRHIDVSAETSTSTVGLDFSGHGEDWGGMLHHSQFKCVQVLSQATVQSQTKLESVYSTGDTEPRLDVPQVARFDGERPWALSKCDLSAATAPSDINPSQPLVSCTVQTTLNLEDVYFAAVGYENQGSGDYERGCINVCEENAITPPECYECDGGPFGQQVNVPVAAHNPPESNCTGGVCDGNGNCGDCVPGDTQCASVTDIQSCLATRTWGVSTECEFACVGTTCSGVCKPGDRQCSTNTPQQCSNAGQWVSESGCGATGTCTGEGVCKKNDGQPCEGAGECYSGVCSTFYNDADSDDYGDSGTTSSVCGALPPSGYVTDNTDCCDSDADAHPNQTGWFNQEREVCGGYDYNCADGNEKRYDVCGCSGTGFGEQTGCGDFGWVGTCGQWCDEGGCYCGVSGDMEWDRQRCH